MLKQVLPNANTDTVQIFFEGNPLDVPTGYTVAAAVLAHGAGHTRVSFNHEKRAPYCHIGVCYECLMEIDGVPNQQACLVRVREGMRVRRQNGVPDFSYREEA